MRPLACTLPLAAMAASGCGYESYYPHFPADLIDSSTYLPCPTGVGAYATLTITNQRTLPVSVSFLNPACDEIELLSLDQGQSQNWTTDVLAVWVVRDAATRQVLDVIELRFFGDTADVVIQ